MSREEILRHSLLFRALSGLWGFLNGALGGSRSVRLAGAIFAVLGRWAAESQAARLFRGWEAPAWHTSRTYMLLSAAAGIGLSTGEYLAGLYRRSRDGSATYRAFKTGAETLGGFPARAAADFMLGFAAANLGVRLATGAYSPLSIVFFLAALAFFAWARFQHRRLTAALYDSFFIRWALWPFGFEADPLPTPHSEEG